MGRDFNHMSEFYKLRWGHRGLIQVMRAAAAMDYPRQPFSMHSSVVDSVCIVQHVYDGPLITAQRLAARKGRPPCPLDLLVLSILGEAKAGAASGSHLDWLSHATSTVVLAHTLLGGACIVNRFSSGILRMASTVATRLLSTTHPPDSPVLQHAQQICHRIIWMSHASSGYLWATLL